MSEPSVLASTTMRRRVLSRWIWLGPSVSTTCANEESGTRPAGVSTTQLGKPFRGAVGVGDAQHHVVAPVAVDDLRDRRGR